MEDVVGANDENRAQDTPTDPQEGVEKTFEQKVLGHFQSQIVQVCAETPELRSVAVVFDWQHGLNQGTQPFIWGDRDGPITLQQASAVAEGLSQGIKLLEYALKLSQATAKYFLKLSVEAEERYQQAEARAKEMLDVQAKAEETPDPPQAGNKSSEPDAG